MWYPWWVYQLLLELKNRGLHSWKFVPYLVSIEKNKQYNTIQPGFGRKGIKITTASITLNHHSLVEQLSGVVYCSLWYNRPTGQRHMSHWCIKCCIPLKRLTLYDINLLVFRLEIANPVSNNITLFSLCFHTDLAVKFISIISTFWSFCIISQFKSLGVLHLERKKLY